MNLKCIIIDDEPLAINVIKNHLSHFEEVTIAASFTNAVQGLNFIENNEVDLVFLDINMPLLDGFSLLKNLNKSPMVIITTAYVEYAVKSYEFEVMDYLVKPISFPRFLKTLNKISNTRTIEKTKEPLPENPYIFIKIDKKIRKKIYLNDIKIIESLKDYIRIITTTGKFIVHQTLSSFTDGLPEDRFIRIHRSFTVSIDKINSIEGNIIDIDGRKYKIGRSYLSKVREVVLGNMN